MNIGFYNSYRDIKNKYKKVHDDNMYTAYIENVTSTMFTWDEKIYRPELLDRMIRDAGVAGLIKTDLSDYTPVWVSFTGGTLLPDGNLSDCTCFDYAGKDYKFSDWHNNNEVLVFFNDFMQRPDIFTDKYATYLSDVDFSILNNVFFSRLHPLPIARDKNTKNRIDEALKSIENGNFSTVLMQMALQDVIDGKSVDVLNLTNVEDSKYIQYLSHLHDSLISRLFFMLGLGTTDNGKQAQISVDELNKNDDASITQVLAWYNARKMGFEEAKQKGHNLQFDFSPLWKSRIDKILAEPVESTITDFEEGSDDNGDTNEGDSGDGSDE